MNNQQIGDWLEIAIKTGAWMHLTLFIVIDSLQKVNDITSALSALPWVGVGVVLVLGLHRSINENRPVCSVLAIIALIGLADLI